MARPGVFGERVIGKEQFQKEQAIVERNAHIYGPKVVGNVLGKRALGEDDEEIEVESLSVKRVEELLGDNKYMVERLLEAELSRPDGVRKGALVAMRDAELSKDEPNEALLETIDEELVAFDASGDEDEDE